MELKRIIRFETFKPIRGCLRRFGNHGNGNSKTTFVNKRGKSLLMDPWYNKGTAFTLAERDRLGLKGLLPPRPFSIEDQVDRFLVRFRSLNLSPIDQWMALSALQDRNETLFYHIVTEHITEMAPIVYTPTVGLACQRFSDTFRTSRGLYVSLNDRAECLPIIYNWPSEDVDIIVVTDGSRILGLGDLGVQGMGISIGKLVLYVAAAGIHPSRTLPVCIDVGTDNKQLKDSPLYLGLRHERCNDEDYISLMDEFMSAAKERWPNVLIQFEDIKNERAVTLLNRYRDKYLCFNDDIQGTGAMTVAGLFSALRAKGLPFSELKNQRIVVVGAGSAGIGVVNTTVTAMKRYGATEAEARSCFWILDNHGLLTQLRPHYALLPGQAAYLRTETEHEGLSLAETIKVAKPNILLGLSGAGGIFSEEVCSIMSDYNTQPIIFPMSNPSSKAECTAETAFKATNGRAIFASGSPFPDYTFSDGRKCRSNQANNMFIFPGLGKGAILGKCEKITDDMLMVAAETLAAFMTPEDLQTGVIYPKVTDIRKVTQKIAAAVIMQAKSEGQLNEESFEGLSQEETEKRVALLMYQAKYPSIVYRGSE